MNRRWFTLLPMAAVAVLVTGCRVDFGVETRVDASGAGEIALTLAGNEDARAELEAAGFPELAALLRGTSAADVEGGEGTSAALVDLLAAGWKLQSGGGVTRVSHTFEAPEQLESLAADLSPLVEDLRLVVDRGVFWSDLQFAASLDFRRETLEALATGGLGAPPTSAELDAALRGSLTDAFRLQFVVEMPGTPEIRAATAQSEQRDPALVWELQPGDTLDVRVASRVWHPARVGLAAGIVVGLVGAVGVGVLWLRGRTRELDVGTG